MEKNKKLVAIILIVITLFNLSYYNVLAESKSNENINKINNVVDFTSLILNIDKVEMVIIGKREMIYDEGKDELKEISTEKEEDKKPVKKKEKKKAVKKKAVKKKTVKKKTVKKKTEEKKGKVKTVSEKDYDSLLRIVEAEAGAEGLKGKIIVANVIFNRFNSNDKYKTIRDVIFEDKQFSPIKDGRYYSVKVTKETKEAVQEVLDGTDYSKGALYFMNEKTASNSGKKWFKNSLKYLFTHNNHCFYTSK